MKGLAALRIAAALMASYGAYAALGITLSHFGGAEPCPAIMGVPACLVVLIGYVAMLLAIIRPHRWIFFAGWLPVFVLAASGVAGEILSDGPVCPQTESGIPKCYFSFALALLLGIAGRFITRPRRAAL